MAEKGQPGGFVQPNSNLPSAPPTYQEAFGAQYQDPSRGQNAAAGYSAPYPTASGAPPYYQQGQQGMAPYPNYSQPPQLPHNASYPYPGGPMPNAPVGQQPPTGYAPYPKVKTELNFKQITINIIVIALFKKITNMSLCNF